VSVTQSGGLSQANWKLGPEPTCSTARCLVTTPAECTPASSCAEARRRCRSLTAQREASCPAQGARPRPAGARAARPAARRTAPSVLDRCHQTLSGQLAQGAGDGGTPRCDEIGKHRMSQPEREDHSVATDASPPVGEVPEEHVQANVDPRLMHDRHVHRQVARALERSRHEAAGELGIGGEAPSRRLVQHGQPDGLQHSPSVVTARVGAMPSPCQGRSRSPSPRSSDPERRRSPHDRSAGPRVRAVRSPLHHRGLLGAPASPGHAGGSDHALLDRPLAPRRIDRREQIGILAQDVAHGRGHGGFEHLSEYGAGPGAAISQGAAPSCTCRHSLHRSVRARALRAARSALRHRRPDLRPRPLRREETSPTASGRGCVAGMAAPGSGGILLGLLLLAVRRCTGRLSGADQGRVGYYVLLALVGLMLAKILATSLTMWIGGSGGVFAPSLFIGPCWAAPTATSPRAAAHVAHAERPTDWSGWARCRRRLARPDDRGGHHLRAHR